MPLAPGTKLGPDEIVSALGARGMGGSLPCEGTRLGRDVAIKILPKEMSADAAKKQRFERVLPRTVRRPPRDARSDICG